MERSEAIRALVRYALDRGLIQPSEEMWAVNALLEALSLDSYTPPEGEPAVEAELPAILDRTPSSTGISLTPSSWGFSPPGPPR